MSRQLKLEVPTWNTDVYCMVGVDPKRWRRLFIAQGVAPANADDFLKRMEGCTTGAQAMWEDKTPWHVYAYFPQCPRPNRADSIATVAHELLHVTIRILSRKSVVLADESEEAFTYLLEHLTRDFWWKLAGRK